MFPSCQHLLTCLRPLVLVTHLDGLPCRVLQVRLEVTRLEVTRLEVRMPEVFLILEVRLREVSCTLVVLLDVRPEPGSWNMKSQISFLLASSTALLISSGEKSVIFCTSFNSSERSLLGLKLPSFYYPTFLSSDWFWVLADLF